MRIVGDIITIIQIEKIVGYRPAEQQQRAAKQRQARRIQAKDRRVNGPFFYFSHDFIAPQFDC